jgi:hypothetical protein
MRELLRARRIQIGLRGICSSRLKANVVSATARHRCSDFYLGRPRGSKIDIKKLLLIINDIGGESVSQSPLKNKAFSISPDQNPPFYLRPKTGVSPPTLSRKPSRLIRILANPSISVGSGQHGWSAFALRRRRPHVRIVSGAPSLQFLLKNQIATQIQARSCRVVVTSGRSNRARFNGRYQR